MIDKELFLQIWIFRISLHVGGSYALHKITFCIAIDGKNVRNRKRRIRNNPLAIK